MTCHGVTIVLAALVVGWLLPARPAAATSHQLPRPEVPGGVQRPAPSPRPPQELPPAVVSVRLSAPTVPGGQTVTGTLSLSRPTSGGVTVRLSSSHAAAALPKTTILIEAGQRTATFVINTAPVTAVTVATISASYGQTTRTADLQISPPAHPYDMEVVSVNPAMREIDMGGGGGRYALWDVTLRNNGSADVVQAGVDCTAGALTLGSLSGGSTYRPGQSGPFTVQHRLPDLWQVAPPGTYAGSCTVRIVQPLGVQDANAANNTRSATFTVSLPTGQPNFYITALSLRDCTTRGAAAAGAAVCAEVEGGATGGWVLKAWQTQCTLAGQTATAAGRFPFKNQTILERIRFEGVAAGTYSLSCTVDATNQIAESNENDNTRTQTVAVLPPGGATYDMEVVSVNPAMREIDMGGGGGRYALWDVTLRNNGNADVVQAGVDCTAGALTLGSLSGGSTYRPGQSGPFTVQHRLPDLWQVAPPGTYTGSCTVRIVQPLGVQDANASNNTRSATFIVSPPSH